MDELSTIITQMGKQATNLTWAIVSKLEPELRQPDSPAWVKYYDASRPHVFHTETARECLTFVKL